MSTVYLVPDKPGLDAVGFDATFNEGHSLGVTPTANAIESGAVVSDHVTDNPEQFSCEVGTTNTPLRPTWYGDGSFQSISVEERTDVGVKPFAVQAFTMTRETDLVREMLERLEALMRARETMTVITTVREYESMLLVQIDLPRGPKSIGGGKFGLSFLRLETVSTATVPAPTPKEPRGKPASPKGEQATKTMADELKSAFGIDIDPNKSLAKNLGGFFGL